MPLFSGCQIPPPANWQDFESLCADLWHEEWRSPDIKRFGRSGQRQNGVDILGIAADDRSAGLQCKCIQATSVLSKKELTEEVEKAKLFLPPLTSYLIATTGMKDTRLEALCLRLTHDHAEDGLFSVAICNWADICLMLERHPSVVKIHFPFLGGANTAKDDPRIMFTSSRLWTPELKLLVRDQVKGFDDFLTSYGVLSPTEKVAPFSITDQRVLQLNLGITPADPPFDQRQIPVSALGTPFDIRRFYGHYLFDNILGVFDFPRRAALLQESWIYADYFAASSLNCPPPSNLLKGWTAALWEMRESELGCEFVDRALMYGIKAPVVYEMPRPNSRGELITYPHDLNRHFRACLEMGALAVKNTFEDFLTVQKILESHGLLR